MTVRNVTEEYKIGYFTPMTGQGNDLLRSTPPNPRNCLHLGTLIVNGMAASCYSSVISHDLAHYMLAPLRWWTMRPSYSLMNNPLPIHLITVFTGSQKRCYK